DCLSFSTMKAIYEFTMLALCYKIIRENYYRISNKEFQRLKWEKNLIIRNSLFNIRHSTAIT
ncbi:MAG: hypothetical protein AABY74_05060, partial [Planctomycetota bacterium]